MWLPSGTFSKSYDQDSAIIRTRAHWFILASVTKGGIAERRDN